MSAKGAKGARSTDRDEKRESREATSPEGAELLRFLQTLGAAAPASASKPIHRKAKKSRRQIYSGESKASNRQTAVTKAMSPEEQIRQLAANLLKAELEEGNTIGGIVEGLRQIHEQKQAEKLSTLEYDPFLDTYIDVQLMMIDKGNMPTQLIKGQKLNDLIFIHHILLRKIQNAPESFNKKAARIALSIIKAEIKRRLLVDYEQNYSDLIDLFHGFIKIIECDSQINSHQDLIDAELLILEANDSDYKNFFYQVWLFLALITNYGEATLKLINEFHVDPLMTFWRIAAPFNVYSPLYYLGFHNSAETVTLIDFYINKLGMQVDNPWFGSEPDYLKNDKAKEEIGEIEASYHAKTDEPFQQLKGNFFSLVLKIQNLLEVNASFGATPLAVAATCGRVDAVKAFIRHGADVNAATLRGHTPLMLAAQDGGLAVVKTLLAKGADPFLRTVTGLCAADCAKTEEIRKEIVSKMLKIVVGTYETGQDYISNLIDQFLSAPSGGEPSRLSHVFHEGTELVIRRDDLLNLLAKRKSKIATQIRDNLASEYKDLPEKIKLTTNLFKSTIHAFSTSNDPVRSGAEKWQIILETFLKKYQEAPRKEQSEIKVAPAAAGDKAKKPDDSQSAQPIEETGLSVIIPESHSVVPQQEAKSPTEQKDFEFIKEEVTLLDHLLQIPPEHLQSTPNVITTINAIKGVLLVLLRKIHKLHEKQGFTGNPFLPQELSQHLGDVFSHPHSSPLMDPSTYYDGYYHHYKRMRVLVEQIRNLIKPSGTIATADEIVNQFRDPSGAEEKCLLVRIWEHEIPREIFREKIRRCINQARLTQFELNMFGATEGTLSSSTEIDEKLSWYAMSYVIAVHFAPYLEKCVVKALQEGSPREYQVIQTVMDKIKDNENWLPDKETRTQIRSIFHLRRESAAWRHPEFTAAVSSPDAMPQPTPSPVGLPLASFVRPKSPPKAGASSAVTSTTPSQSASVDPAASTALPADQLPVKVQPPPRATR